jgi:hypothetical protein
VVASRPVSTVPLSRLIQPSWWLLLATLGAAVALRLYGLDHLPGINADEAVFPVHASEWMGGVPLSELRTGTNLPMNPLFFGLVALIQFCLPTSLWTLRLAALTHSLLSVALGFVLFRKRGLTFAVVFATLLAVLPIQLGYARLAWDPTAVPTALVLALAAATRGRSIETALAFGLCLWVHPATAFAAPILLTPLILRKWPCKADGSLLAPSKEALAIAALGSALAVALFSQLVARDALPTPVLAALRGELPAKVFERLTSLGSALEFARLYADFLAGPTIYRYVTGSMPELAATLHLAAAVVLLGACVLPALVRLPAATKRTDRAVALGLGLSLVGAYLVGGLPVLAPHTERYGMFLVVPSCYVLAACIEAYAVTPVRAALARLGTAGLGATLLASFGTYFLAALHQADPARHNTFRSGAVDPKQRAFEQILAWRSPDRIGVVRAEDWWLYWPLRYLAGAGGELRVSIDGARWDYRFPADFMVPELDPEDTDVFGVAWAGSDFDASLARDARERVEVGGYEPGPILHVYRLSPPHE